MDRDQWRSVTLGLALAAGLWACGQDHGAGEEWGAPVQLGGSAGQRADRVEIAMEPDGDAVVVWQQTVVPPTTHVPVPSWLFASRYRAGQGWDARASQLVLGERQYLANPRVALDPGGSILVASGLHGGFYIPFDIVVSLFEPALGWDGPMALSPEQYGSMDYRVAGSASGRAVLVWNDGQALWSHVREAGSGWSEAQVLDRRLFTVSPRIAADAAGGFIAVWIGYVDALQRFVVLTSRSADGRTWSEAAPIPDSEAGGSLGISPIALDSAGRAMIVWPQAPDHQATRLWGSRFTPEHGWEPAKLIADSVPGWIEAPQVAFDGGGRAVAVWRSRGGTEPTHIRAARFDGLRWEAPEVLETSATSGLPQAVSLASDGRGRSLAAWDRWDGQRSAVWFSRHMAGGGWSPARQLAPRSGGPEAFDARVAFDPQGQAIAVWAEGEPKHSAIWTSRSD